MPKQFGTAFDVPQIATPSAAPAAGRQLLYFKSDGNLYTLNPDGSEEPISPVAPSLHLNPSFDQVSGGVPVQWTGFFLTSPVVVSSDTSVGNYVAGASARLGPITGTNVGTGVYAENSTHSINDQQAINFAVWIKTNVAAANNPVVSIMHLTAVLQADASYLNPNSVTTTRLVVPTSGWVRYSVSFGVPPGHLWGRFMLGMNTTGTPSGNYVWFDESYSEAVQATPTAAPVGSITMYGGTTAPAGWLICDGTSLLRTDYPVLFSTIGTAFGSVDSTHFTLPNLQDRFPQGAGTNALATTGGKTASDIVNHTHTTASHQHPVGVVYTVNNTTGGSATRMADVLGASGAGGTSATPNTQGSGALTTGNPLQTSVATGENRPPFLTLNYIIRAT